MKLELLEDLYREQLLELYGAEKQLLGVLRQIAKVVSLDNLKQCFATHGEETSEQIKRLEEILIRRSGGAQETKSKAMDGLLATTKELFKRPPSDQQLFETALISAAQKVEAHETTCYASLHTFAKFLGFHDDLVLLEKSFQEEQRMEDQLAALAEGLTFEATESETSVTEIRPLQSS